jgi:hypothetical protein
VLDAALISIAAVASGADHGRPPLPADSGLTVAALGCRPLVLVHACSQRQCAPHASRTRWQLLLPPEALQPLIWRQFRQLDLLPLQECADSECSSWLQHLQQKPCLLPAHLSLVEAPGWRQAALQAVPAPEQLQESLWLLLRQEDSGQERIQLLQNHLRDRIRWDPAEEP